MDNENGGAWYAIERSRRQAAWRRIAIMLGDCYVEIGRAWILNTGIGGVPNLRHAGKAAGAILKACDFYGVAGLSRRSATAWRYARLLHRARSREAGLQ